MIHTFAMYAVTIAVALVPFAIAAQLFNEIKKG